MLSPNYAYLRFLIGTFAFRKVMFRAMPNPRVTIPAIATAGPKKLPPLPVLGTEKVAVEIGTVGVASGRSVGVTSGGSVGVISGGSVGVASGGSVGVTSGGSVGVTSGGSVGVLVGVAPGSIGVI